MVEVNLQFHCTEYPLGFFRTLFCEDLQMHAYTLSFLGVQVSGSEK